MGWIRFNQHGLNEFIINELMNSAPHPTSSTILRPRDVFVGEYEGDEHLFYYTADTPKTYQDAAGPWDASNNDYDYLLDGSGNLKWQIYSYMVEHFPSYEMPERNYAVTHVPGRNGDGVFDPNDYKNVDREYEFAFVSQHPVVTYNLLAAAVSHWLHQGSGYLRLEDSYEPNVYRLAMYKENNTFANILNQGGRATIKFNCQPQRFLKSGEAFGAPIDIALEDAYSTETVLLLDNKTLFPYTPILRFTMHSYENTGEIFGVGASTKIQIGKNINGVFTVLWELMFMESLTNYVGYDSGFGLHVDVTFSFDCETGEIFDISSYVDSGRVVQYPKDQILVSNVENLAASIGPKVYPNDQLYVRMNIQYDEGASEFGTPFTPLKCEVKSRCWTI